MSGVTRTRGRHAIATLVGAVPIFFAAVAASSWGSPVVLDLFAAVVARGAPLADPPLLLRAVRVADARAWRPTALSDVRVRAGRVSSVAPAGSIVPAPDERIIDGRGRTLTPGLVDARSEIVYRDPLRRALPPSVVRDSLRAQVRAGVTSVRDLGSPLAAAGRLRAALGRRLIGPAAVLSGPWVVLASTPDELDDPHRSALEQRVVEDAGEVTDAVDAAAAGGATWLAVRPPASLEGPGTRTRLDALAREARARGLDLAVRTVDEASLRWALAAGARSVDELADCPAELPDELIGQIVRSGAVVVPLAHLARVRDVGSNGEYELDKQTRWIGRASWWGELARLDRAIRSRHDGPADRDRAQARLQRLRGNLSRLVAAGVPIAMGTGAPSAFAFPERPGDEIAELVNAGLSGVALAEACTLGGARLVSRDEPLAVVAEGAPASLVVWDCDPLDDARCYQRPAWVVVAGRVVEGRTIQSARPFL